ncbi:endonuclease/exonuclease/phosphatase family protein [Streptosporangium sp. NPDC004379]|uniref:endonuclease/exonuclease/phosphatase family protein n=1 Tax=Streptosporangium sp. NPDC004379 TaxID=3366189 RepID=UPI0036C85D2D
MSLVDGKPFSKIPNGARTIISCVLALLCLLIAQAPPAAGETPASGESAVAATTLVTPKKQTLKLLQFNMAGAAKNGGEYGVVDRIIQEVQARKPDVISLNEVCNRQYDHLRVRLEEIGHAMDGLFQESKALVPQCQVGLDIRNKAGNAVLVRGTVNARYSYLFSTDHKLYEGSIPIPPQDRSVACVDATFALPLDSVKACSTHLSPKDGSASNPYAAPEAEAKELARVFGPEAKNRAFILMGDLNLKPGNPALNSLYAPAAGTTGEFWETDMHYYCSDTFCDGPVQGGDPSHAEGKIDYTFVGRKHFSFAHQNVQMVDAGNCGDHICSDHKMFRSEVTLHQWATIPGLVRNNYSGKCLSVTGTANGAKALQATCNPLSGDQRWRFQHAFWGEYFLVKDNGSCLQNPSSVNKAGAVQTLCYLDDSMQRWLPDQPQPGMVRLVGSGKCLMVGSLNVGTAVMNATCDQTATAHRWTSP